MQRPARRPIDITLVSILVAINGIASLVEAFGLAELPSFGANAPSAVLSAIIGLALLHRAYAIWNLQRGAWLITLLLICLRAMLAVLPLIVAPPTISGWVNLALVVAALLYLIQPSVRNLFSEGHIGS